MSRKRKAKRALFLKNTRSHEGHSQKETAPAPVAKEETAPVIEEAPAEAAAEEPVVIADAPEKAKAKSKKKSRATKAD